MKAQRTYAVTREPTAAELRDCQKMLAKITSVPRREWASKAGSDLLAELAALQDAGVPLTWMAEQLDLNVAALRPLVRQHRRRTA